MRKETAVSMALVMAFVAGFLVLMVSLPWLDTLGPSQPTVQALPHAAPARLSGQAIALTCARMANVDMAGLITLAQVQEMEQCAERMMAITR